jgi:Holliday junction resolvasome RuvABC endonuclease subunit
MSSPRLSRDQAVRLLGAGALADRDLFPEAKPKRARPVRQPGKLVPPATRVLGLDLASVKTGWALVEARRVLATGTIKLPDSPRVRETRPGLLLRQYRELVEDVRGLITEYHPQVIAYEWSDRPRRMSWGRGEKGREYVVGQALGRVEAFLIVATADLDVELIPVPMTAAKRLATGSPDASKGRVRLSLEGALGHSLAGASADEADGISIALAVLEEE